jgi:hypothetical protein
MLWWLDYSLPDKYVLGDEVLNTFHFRVLQSQTYVLDSKIISYAGLV